MVGGMGCDGQEVAALAFGRPSRQLLLPYEKRPAGVAPCDGREVWGVV